MKPAVVAGAGQERRSRRPGWDCLRAGLRAWARARLYGGAAVADALSPASAPAARITVAVPRGRKLAPWPRCRFGPTFGNLQHARAAGLGSMSARRLFALGSVNADFQMRLDAATGSAETLPAHHFMRLSGGKAANVALLARRLGCEATLLGRTGRDDLAEQALAPLRAAGVDLAGLTQTPAQATAVSVITVPPDGKKHIVLANNANDAWDESAIAQAEALLRAAAPCALLVADYEVPAAVVQRALQAARARGLPVVLDPSFPDRVDKPLLRGLRAITPNGEEAQALTGVDCAQELECARALAALGPQIVCLKLSDGGCVLGWQGRYTRLRAPRMEVVDSTGAGDAFTGAFAVALLEGRDPLQAARHGVAASALAVTVYGSQPAYPDRARLEALLSRVAVQAA